MPARLAWGMAAELERRGVRVFEASAATGLSRNGAGVRVTTAHGHVDARDVVIATAAYPAPLKRLGNYIMPLYDHVLMTEPLTEAQRGSIGWGEGQGLTDAGNQFHYYRPTVDGRILFGGHAPGQAGGVDEDCAGAVAGCASSRHPLPPGSPATAPACG